MVSCLYPDVNAFAEEYRINSVFGSVAFTLRAGDDPGTVIAHVVPPTTRRPERIWLHVRLPDGKHIREVKLDGKEWTQFDLERERIMIPADREGIDLVIRY